MQQSYTRNKRWLNNAYIKIPKENYTKKKENKMKATNKTHFSNSGLVYRLISGL